MPIEYAERPNSVHWKTWLKRRFFTTEIRPDTAEIFTEKSIPGSSLFYETFCETYEPDGLDISYGKPVTAPDIEDAKKHSPVLTMLFASFITFIGLPSRLTWFESTSENISYTGKFSDKGKYYYGLTLKQFGKNLIGGWDSRPDISLEKKIWQYLSLFLKIPIILLKILTFPFKLLLNIVKVFTEFLPLFLSKLTARGINRAQHLLRNSQFQFTGKYVPFQIDDPNIPDVTLHYENLPQQELANGPGYWFGMIGLVLAIALLGVFHYTLRMITLIGRAITSPAKSVRMAFAYGRELEGEVLGTVVGLFLAGLSITLTATLWFIALPLSISAIATYIPAIFQAMTWVSQLPIVVSTLSWLGQVPILTASIGLINSGLTTLGIALSAVFGPALGTLGALIGVKISLSLIITTSALTIIVAPLSVAISLVGDKLSNMWASSKNSGPFTKLYNAIISSRTSSKTESEPLLRNEHEEGVPMEPTSAALELVKQSEGGYKRSLKADKSADLRASAALQSNETSKLDHRPRIDFEIPARKKMKFT